MDVYICFDYKFPYLEKSFLFFRRDTFPFDTQFADMKYNQKQTF